MATSSLPTQVISVLPSLGTLESLGFGSKSNLNASDSAKIRRELAISRKALEGDPKKICKLLQLGLSFFPDNSRVVTLKVENSGFLVNALLISLHILSIPRDFLPEWTKDILDRISTQYQAESTYSLTFSSRDIKEIQRILSAGRWTLTQIMELRQTEGRNIEDFLAFFEYDIVSPRHPTRAIPPSLDPPSVNTPLIAPATLNPPARNWFRILGFTCGLARQKGTKAPILNSSETSVTPIQVPTPTPSAKSLNVKPFGKDAQPSERWKQKDYEQMEKELIQKTKEFDDLKIKWNKSFVYIRDYQAIRYQEIDLKNKEAARAAEIQKVNQATIKRCREEIESRRVETEKIKSNAASNLASALKEVARWRTETDAKSKELASALEFRNQQQERHEREFAEKDAELQMANLAVKTARKELSQVQKQAEKKVRSSASTVTDLNVQLKAKEIELEMLARSNTELETKAAAFEAENIAFRAELEALRKEKESFESEKARFLAFRTNPEAEKDRTEKAVEQAVQDAVRDAVAAKDIKLRYLENQLDHFEEGRATDQNTIRELLGDKYRLKEKVKDDELYQAGLEDRVSSLEREVAGWQQYFRSLTQPSKVKFLNPEAADWTP